MRTRREFIRKASIGSIAFSSLGAFTANAKDILGSKNPDKTVRSDLNGIEPYFSEWEVLFDEANSKFSSVNELVSISGQLGFVSGTNKWAVVNSRDGIKTRLAFVDLKGNVQGYLVLKKNSGQLQIYFYHRTAQAYQGVLTFEGEINFQADSFACRTRPKVGERVLSLSCGKADSLLNDSLFAPESDSILQLNSANLNLNHIGNGTYTFMMSGQIGESSEAVFTINLEKNYFKNRYIPYYHALNRKRCPKTPSGWMSWNTYFDKATAEDNLAEARIGRKYLQPFGCEFWSIESWQGNSDQLPVRDFHNMNLETSERKFPKGMKQLADDIRMLGFRPGLWTAPFGTGNQEFYEAHKGWFLHDKNGKPISSWNGRYTLDPTVPEAREHLKKIHQTASREWGFEFFKIDGMSGRNHGYCAHLYERPEIKACFHDPSCPNPFGLSIKAFRDGIGEDRVLLACQGHSSGPEPLYADASRIGADIVHPNQPVKWSNVFNQGRCTINQIFTHNIVMVNDPDTLLVRDLPLEEARVSATIVALPGQLTFFGDKLAGLSDDRMKILQQTLPVANVHPVSLYPYFSMLPVWNLQIKNPFLENYNIVALFNWADEKKTMSFSTEEIGARSDVNYLLYEFWTQKSYGTITQNFAMEVPARSVRLLAMHPLKKAPQWISSDRHITQNAVELKEFKWDDLTRTLEGKIELIGLFPLTMRLYIPQGFSLSGTECDNVECTARKEENSMLAVTFKSDKTGDFKFIIKF